MARFRFQLGSPEACDGSGDFDDWVRRRLSYLSFNNQRYKIIARHYLEDSLEAHPMMQLAQFDAADPSVEVLRKVQDTWPALCSTYFCKSPKAQRAR